jgi:hypothetical protein
VQIQDTELGAAEITKYSVRVQPLFSKGDNGNEVRRHGRNGLPALDEPPQASRIPLADSSIPGFC